MVILVDTIPLKGLFAWSLWWSELLHFRLSADKFCQLFKVKIKTKPISRNKLIWLINSKRNLTFLKTYTRNLSNKAKMKLTLNFKKILMNISLVYQKNFNLKYLTSIITTFFARYFSCKISQTSLSIGSNHI